jgi:hypothetical protein
MYNESHFTLNMNPGRFILTGAYINFNLFFIFFKITFDKHYLHLVTPLAAPGGMARQPTFAAPHAVARERCHAGQPRPAGQAWARDCHATCTGSVGLPRHPAWRGSDKSRGRARPPFFFFLPLFSPRPELPLPRTAAGGRRPPIRPQIGGFGVGKVGEFVPRVLVKVFMNHLLLSLFYRCIV